MCIAVPMRVLEVRNDCDVVVTRPGRTEIANASFADEMPEVGDLVLVFRGTILRTVSQDEALKIEPDYPQALIRRGLALSQLGYADDAFDDLTKAIRLEPSAEAYLSRGICLLQQGNTAGARKDLEEVLRRDDRSYRVWNILGAVSLKEGKEQEACEAFEKACSSGDCAGIEAARREKICK